MKIETEITRNDLIRFNLAILLRMKSTYVTIIVVSVIIFSFLAFNNGLPKTSINWLSIIFASIAGGIGGMLGGIIFSLISILFSSNKNNGILGYHEYTVDEKGLYEKTKANESLNKWEGIHEIIITKSFLLFKISGYLFHIIPKRSFLTDEEFKEFINIAYEKWSKAHNK